MILEEKKEYILNKLNENKILRIDDLARDLGCTTASVRYIVNDLSEKKLLKRVHGGVAIDNRAVLDMPENIVKTRNIEMKEYIADIAVNLISDNSTIILDSGTTNVILANKIRNFKNLNIITNSIKIAYLLMDRPNLNIIVIGGAVRTITHSIVNYGKENILEYLQADKLFLNCGAVTIKEGVTDPNMQEAKIKRDIIERSKEVVLLADSSKFGKISLSLVCTLDKINKIITDNSINQEYLERIREMNTAVLN